MTKGDRVRITEDYPAKLIQKGDAATIEHVFANDPNPPAYATPFVNVTLDRLPRTHDYHYATILAEHVEPFT